MIMPAHLFTDHHPQGQLPHYLLLSLASRLAQHLGLTLMAHTAQCFSVVRFILILNVHVL